MKNFIKSSLFIIVVFALCFTSCSKNDNTPTPTPPDNKTLLIANTWSIVKLAADDNKNGKLDDAEYKPLPVGTTYYYLTFTADGTLISRMSDGNKISIISYSWELIDTRTIKLVNQASAKDTFLWHIKTLTATQLNLEQYGADNTINSGAQCVAK